MTTTTTHKDTTTMSIPEPDRQTVADSLRRAFPHDHEEVLREMRWDGLCGCWMIERWHMWIGIERDGYVHS